MVLVALGLFGMFVLQGPLLLSFGLRRTYTIIVNLERNKRRTDPQSDRHR